MRKIVSTSVMSTAILREAAAWTAWAGEPGQTSGQVVEQLLHPRPQLELLGGVADPRTAAFQVARGLRRHRPQPVEPCPKVTDARPRQGSHQRDDTEDDDDDGKAPPHPDAPTPRRRGSSAPPGPPPRPPSPAPGSLGR